MLRYFCSLAIKAFPCPFADVRPQGRPYYFLSNCLACSFNARVPKTVDRVEDLLSMCERNERPCWSVGHVNDERLLSDVNHLEMQTCPSFLTESPEVWVQCLCICHFFPVDAEVPNGVDDAFQVGEGC